MAEQSFQNHTYRPTETVIAWLLALIALVLLVMQLFFGRDTRDWALLFVILSAIQLGWITRAYVVRLQDRIILTEMKIRAAELLPAGQDAQLSRLSKQQIIALRFASDDELGPLLERAVRDNLPPREIKAAIKHWRPDLLRT